MNNENKDQHKRGFLDRCEQEPLQFSGEIQSFGALFICQQNGLVSHISANLPELTDLPITLGEDYPSELSGLIANLELNPGSKLYAEEILAGKGRAEESLLVAEKSLLVPEKSLLAAENSLDAILTRCHSGAVIVELMPHQASRSEPEWIEPPAFGTINNEPHRQNLQDSLIHWITQVSGYDRVMYYQFLPGGEGEVQSEARQQQAEGSYLGLRFPASDVPQIAREIYRKNPWRTISDSASDSVAILKLDAPDIVMGQSNPDLTLSDLRSVAKVHAIYMQNMGDRASFTLPIMGSESLDALISCHSPTPGKLSLARQQAISQVVVQYNTQLREYRTRCRMKVVDEFAYQTNQMLAAIQALQDQQARWEKLAQWLLSNFSADTLVLHNDEKTWVSGLPVETHTVEQLDHWFIRQSPELAFSTDYLQGLDTEQLLLTEMAGVAGLKVTPDNGQPYRLYLFRKEEIQEVAWGGNPDKPVEYHDGEWGISPRRSFAKWVEKKLGYSRPWPSDTKFRLLRLRGELNRLSKTVPH